MTGDKTPNQPNASQERQKQTDYIPTINHQIGDPLRGLHNQAIAFVNEVKTNNETSTKSEKENQHRAFRWLKISTISSIILAGLSLLVSVFALTILYNQGYSMRIENRAWIKIEQGFEPIAENKPLVAIVNITNIRKTPAKRVEQQYTVQKVSSNTSPDLHPIGGYSRFIPIINPEVVAKNKVPLFTEAYDLFNPALLTKADIDDFNSGKAYAAVVGKITYIDVYGISHWINYCHWQSFRNGEYEARICAEYNDVDNN